MILDYKNVEAWDDNLVPNPEMAEMSYAACFGPFGNVKSCAECDFNGSCGTQEKCDMLLAKGWRKANDLIDELVKRIGDSLNDEEIMNTIRTIAEELKEDL